LTGDYNSTALLLSLVPFFLVNNLLLLNQIPDIEPDRSVGRDNYAIVLGSHKRAHLFLAFSLFAYLSIISGTLTGLLPIPSLISLFTAGLVPAIFKTIKCDQLDMDTLIPSLGKNVILTLATPLLTFLGILIGVYYY
jgi:1,4-dihydroxy-2-naphthoate octaprenyltransferase